jgi:hypothetical protein
VKDDFGNNKKVQYYYLIVFSILAIFCFGGLYYLLTHLAMILDPYNNFFPANLFFGAISIPVLGLGLVVSILVVHFAILDILK